MEHLDTLSRTKNALLVYLREEYLWSGSLLKQKVSSFFSAIPIFLTELFQRQYRYLYLYAAISKNQLKKFKNLVSNHS